MNDAVTLILGVVILSCLLTPVILASAGSRGVLIFMAVLLSACAGVMLAFTRGIGDSVAVAAVWIGALITGLAAYLDRIITRAVRGSTYRLLNDDAKDLTKPANSD